MFRLLATTKCKRQQIAILIISFFAYVAGIRNEGNNMLLEQQQELERQQQTTIENSNNESPIADTKQQTTLNFRPSQVINFTPADAAIPQQFKPTYIEAQHSTNNNIAIRYNNNNSNINNNITQKQETQNGNRRYTIQTAATHENAAAKQFSFPNEQQQIPQHLTDKPIYIYRDPFTNENYHYTPTETNVVKDTAMPTNYNHNNYNSNAYKQQNSHHHPQHEDNQEYLVQSSMTVGMHQQQHQQQESNPYRPYMSLSADKDVYLKRPGLVYDEKLGYNHHNSAIDKKSAKEVQTLKVNKISYDSHDYPPPSYFQQQTSNFLPTPVPTEPSTARPLRGPTHPPTPPSRKGFRPPLPTQATTFSHQRPQQQYLQTSHSTLPNYANSIDNYLLNKQPTSDYYRTETPPSHFFQQQQRPQIQQQYENRPPSFQYESRPPSPHEQHHQYFSRPSYNSAEIPYPQYETSRPPPGRPSYNNYYMYQIGEIPPYQTSSPSSQQFNYPYHRPPPQYQYQRPYRPSPPAQQQQQSGLATLAQYAPQFTSLLLGGIGSGGATSNTNGPLGSLIGALTGSAISQQSSSSSSSSSYNRRPINSQLIKALENIAHNDDLQCVPKVLCQMIAAQTQRGQLPTFITSPAIANFLAGFPAASPALIYGRAALLGLSGGDKICHQTYVNCPKDENGIIHYLNNHRGGFFKFFSEPEEQQPTVNHESTQQGSTSLFSILSALTGTPQTSTTSPRPTQKPPADVTSGIANFFTQLLSDYMGGASVEYQRRFKRRTKKSVDNKIKFEGESESESEENPTDKIQFQDENKENQRDVIRFKNEDFDADEYSHQDYDEDFHDEEDEEDTQPGVSFQHNEEQGNLDNTEENTLYKTLLKGNDFKFFPEMRKESSTEVDRDEELKKIIKRFNDFNTERKLKFPNENDQRSDVLQQKLRQGKELYNDWHLNEQKYGQQFNNYVENSFKDFQKENQKVKFINNNEGEDNQEQEQSSHSDYLKYPEKENVNIVFPERGGKILNHPYYDTSYLQEYQQQEQLEEQIATAQNDKFIMPNNQRPLRFTEYPSTSSENVHNTHINSLNEQNSFSSNTDVYNKNYVPSAPANINSNSNHFLPTPAPSDNEYTTSSNSIYSNKDYSSNQQNYNTLNQKHPSASSSSTSSFNSGSNNFYKPQLYISNREASFNRYHSSHYTTKRPYTTSVYTTRKSDDKNIYVTNSQGVTHHYITPDGKKIYL